MDNSVTALLNGIENPPLNGEHRVMKKLQSGGRPSLDAYLEPEETDEIAVTAQRIQENYPFFGTLLKEEKGLFRRKEVISRKNPQTIEQIEKRLGGGKYQVRLKLEDGTEDHIHFFIPETRQETGQPVQSPEDRNFMDSLRREVREETRQEFEQVIDSLERRLKSKDNELDDLTGKVRRLTMEIAEAERQSNSTVRTETAALSKKIEELKEEVSNLKFDNFELQQELKYADVDTGFDFKEIMSEALKNPELVRFLSPLLAKLQPQVQPAPLAEAPASIAPENASPETANENAEPKPSNEQEKMQYLLNQFTTAVVQTVSSAMIHGNPGPEDVKKVITEGVRNLQGNGLQTQPGLYIQIAKSLIDVALHHSVEAAKAAETIKPVLEQLDGAADKLKYFPADAAANFLIDHFGIEATPEQRAYLSEVLSAFKKQLKQG